MASILSKRQLEKILRSHLKTDNFVLISSKEQLFESQYDGLLGEQYRLHITYEIDNLKKTKSFFMKTLNGSNKVMVEIGKSIRAFEKEEFFYTHIVEEYRRRNIDTSYLADYFLLDSYTIVLEDLTDSSFQTTDKKLPLDLNHCRMCLEVLSKFHAASMIYENQVSREKSEEFSLAVEHGNFLNDVLFSETENAATKWVRCSIKGLFKLIDVIPENEVSKTSFKTRLESALLELTQESETISKGAMLHGDLWSSNFLFKSVNGKLIDCKLVDFQTLKYGPPALDVMQFIMTNTRRKFREEHLDSLLEHYYDSLKNIFEQQDMNLEGTLTKSDFLTSCNLCTFPAKIIAAMDRSITFLADESFEEAARSEEAFRKFIFDDRDQIILESFNKNKDFRELLTEDMVEIRDLLFPRGSF